MERNKNYTYKFADGTESEAEITPEIAALLKEFDDKEKSDNRKETRRHVSTDMLAEKGVGISDERQDIGIVLERNDFYREEIWREQMQKQAFRKHLTDQQAEAFYRHKILDYNKSKIARQLGITEGAARKLIEKAEKKLYGIVIQRFKPTADFTFEDIDFEDTSFLEDLLTV